MWPGRVSGIVVVVERSAELVTVAERSAEEPGRVSGIVAVAERSGVRRTRAVINSALFPCARVRERQAFTGLPLAVCPSVRLSGCPSSSNVIDYTMSAPAAR